jgi:hypothetical protein
MSQRIDFCWYRKSSIFDLISGAFFFMPQPAPPTISLDLRCRENGIKHRLAKINHPWTNGQVERMNRTLKEATFKRYHYDSHDQLEKHLQTFLAAYNYAKRLKTLCGLTPYEYICKCWTEMPDRFRLNLFHHTEGSNTF